MKASLTVTGLKDLDAALAEFTKATARNVLRRAAVDAAQPMVDRMKELAPKRSGKLEAGIQATVLTENAGKAAFAGAKADGASDGEARQAAREANAGPLAVVVSIGPTGSYGAGLAHLDEFGTAHSPPRPFIRPAFDETKDEAIGRMATSLKAEIDKASARAARKAAKTAGG